MIFHRVDSELLDNALRRLERIMDEMMSWSKLRRGLIVAVV